MSVISLVILATNERLVIEMFTTSFIRRSLTGAAVFAISILLLASTGCKQSKDTDTDVKQPTTTTEVSTTCTTSTTMSTTTTSTTSSMTTGTTTTELMTIAETPTTTAQVNTVQIEPEPTTAWVEPEPTWTSNTPISDYEYVLLANVVANEYGSNWVSVPEKAKVVATVVNRTNSSLFPNTIEGVLTQPYQFTGYVASGYYQPNVTESCKQAVDYYYEHPDEFGNWFYFWGDGQMNHFS